MPAKKKDYLDNIVIKEKLNGIDCSILDYKECVIEFVFKDNKKAQEFKAQYEKPEKKYSYKDEVKGMKVYRKYLSPPKLFIIETSSFQEEDNNVYDGKLISDILRLSYYYQNCEKIDSPIKYFYVRTKQEIEYIMKEFLLSKCLYLHISAHANKNGIRTTIGEDIKLKELHKILKPYITKKRLFFSACELISDEFKRAVLKNTGCVSVVGPNNKISFDKSALIWSAFYHLLFNSESGKPIIGKDIRRIIRMVGFIFNFKMNGFFKKKTDVNEDERYESIDNESTISKINEKLKMWDDFEKFLKI